MKDWVPLFVAIVWPVTIVLFYKYIRSILIALEKRIGRGSALTTPFFSVGADVSAKGADELLNGPCGAPSTNVSADARSLDLVPAIAHGVCLEVHLNKEVAESILGDLSGLLHGNGLIPLRRLNEKATAGFLQYPLVPLDSRVITRAWIYLQEITMFNRLVDSISEPSAPDDYKKARISQALTFRDRLKKSGSELLAAIGNEASKG